MLIFVVLVLALIIISLIYPLIKWAEEKNKYWEKRKINFLKPKLFFGNFYEVLLGQKNVSEIHEAIYSTFPDDDVVGFYELLATRLIIRKPELIEKVLKNDFSHFTDRSKPKEFAKNPLGKNLFNMCGNQWRAFRRKLNPIFTNGKLKYLYGPMSECGNNISELIKSKIGTEVDMKDLMEIFSMDVIGSCAFGIEHHVLQNPPFKFRAIGKKMFEFSILQYIKFLTLTLLPKVAMKLNLTVFKHEKIQYYCEILLNTLQHRRKHNVDRNDFVQLLLQLQSRGKIEVQLSDPIDDYLNLDNKAMETYEFTVTDELLMGTAFSFLTAGFHTTAATLTYALYELSQNPHLIDRARVEIDDQVSIHGGINYDSIKCMIYLEKVIKETMRLHPVAPSIFRVCTKKYKFPNGLVVLPGDSIIIPISAVQKDPQYHNDPLRFNPDRFDEIPKSGTYLPFGEGPRICIGLRFAMLEMKFALAEILLNYNFELSPKTKIPLRMTPRGFLNIPKDEVIFRITKR